MRVPGITSAVVGSTTSGSTGSGDVATSNSGNGDPQAASPGDTDTYAASSAGAQPLSADDQALIAKLAARDREVRAHEAAHQAAGGGLVGGASFSYQHGPDGKSYAVGGEVSVDSGAASDPQATIAKMDQVKAAALAPAAPSGQDRAVAAQATAIQQQARAEVATQRQEAASATTSKADEKNPTGEAFKPTAGSPDTAAIKAYASASLPTRSGAVVDVSA